MAESGDNRQGSTRRSLSEWMRLYDVQEKYNTVLKRRLVANVGVRFGEGKGTSRKWLLTKEEFVCVMNTPLPGSRSIKRPLQECNGDVEYDNNN